PEFFSVTYGAGGSTRERTLETALEIREATGIDVAPHLSCIGSTREELRNILKTYMAHGIRRIVALRGDLPSGMAEPGELRHANELVAFIREETGDHFHIEVAAYPEFHPQAKSARDDLFYFKQKVKAGADSAITQYFYNPDAYTAFLEDCRELAIPIIPGIMPITNYTQLARFSAMCGAEIPRWLRWRLEDLQEDPDALLALGKKVVIGLCQRLIEEGAPGLHFYTMNRAEPTFSICQALAPALSA
ncbi:MAG: methylenetetrahydrofolate reductase [NAD(P)H], partial [Gammaproteobacteria bacterium]